MSLRVQIEGAGSAALNTARARLALAGSLFALAFVIVGVRLIDVSVVRAADDIQVGPKHAIASQARHGRADIVDRNGTLLASSLVTASLFGDPARVLDPADAARRLATVLPELSVAEVTAKLSTDKRFVWLHRHLTPRQQYEINRLGIPGIDFRPDEKRLYPQGPLTAHIVGYSDVDGTGIAGIERNLDEVLRGGKEPLALSIDIRVQQIVRDELIRQIDRHRAIGGGGLVMDVETGEILSLVSLPDFDPNAPTGGNPDNRFNRIALGVYELGSVFKIFNHAMVLERGVASLNKRYDATRPLRISRFTINDFHPEKRPLTVTEIFEVSSNIGSALMALDAGGAAQRAFLERVGMFRKLPLELPEMGEPMLPSPWRDISVMTIAYGHGIAVSPLHLATAVAGIVDGGIMHPPTLLMREPDAVVPGTRIVSERTSAIMRSLMRLVVETGTGKNADVPGYIVGGKTGTAEKQVGGRYKKKALITTFVGIFPANAPRYVVVAMLDEPKGIKETYGYATAGWTAAPVAKRIIARMAPLVGVPQQDPNAPEVRRALALPTDTPRAAGTQTVAVN